MKAKELIEFLQQYPEAEVVLTFNDEMGNEYESSVSSLEYSKEKATVFISENRHF